MGRHGWEDRWESFFTKTEETMQWRRVLTIGSQVAVPLVLVGIRMADAGGFGIAGLDGFIGTFNTGITGLGATVGSVGLVGYVGSLMDNPFSTILSGSVNFITKAGILGGGIPLLQTLGLTPGATL
jgi:hypothetical protein